MEPKAPAEARRGLALRLMLTALALAVWAGLAGVSPRELAGALGRIAPASFAWAVALTAANHLVGALRWRALLAAFGATAPPSFGGAFRLYLEGTFFNTFLPANVGGDVLRAHRTRRAFAGGAAGAYLVVLLERLFGLAGLLGLAGIVLGVRPVGSLEPSALPFLLAAAALAGALALPWVLRRSAPLLARHALTEGIGQALAGAPRLLRRAPLAGALLLSFVTHAGVALACLALLSDLAPGVTLTDALVLVPVALIATYLPTLGGLGTREAAFVLLFGWIGVEEAEATAASLGLYGALVCVALLGGALHLLHPREP
ncbi:MAG: lysylphosphatidylglycerol synthase transmembrane domain-containing protein [Myxococcota bacterium]